MLLAKAIKAVSLWLILGIVACHLPVIGQNEDLAYQLLSEGKLLRSKQELQKITAQNPENHDALIVIAWIDHWLGYQNKAEKGANHVLALEPGNEEALNLLESIAEMRKPIVAFVEQFQSDDQPMSRWNSHAGLHWYRSNLLHIQLDFNHYAFLHDSSNSAFVAELSNSFFDPHSRITFTTGIGIFNAQANEFLWNFSAGKSLTKALYLEAGMHQKPYFSTLSSVQHPETTLSLRKEISLTLNQKEKWLGKAVIESNQFGKDEAVKTQYAWIVAPLIHKNFMRLGMGYAYSHSDSDSLTFIPKTEENGGYIPNPDGGLMGVYNPYFSPKNQSVHWALLTLEIPIKSSIQWKTRVSYGVLATADNPYLYEDLNGNGELFVDNGYTDERYYPAEIETSFIFSLGEKIEFQATYLYQNLFFYKASGGSLEIKYRIGK